MCKTHPAAAAIGNVVVGRHRIGEAIDDDGVVAHLDGNEGRKSLVDEFGKGLLG
jgi:hypothetical protein